MSDKKIKVLIAKPGLDGHESGAKLIARALVDAGMEVTYTGTRQTPEMIFESAKKGQVDIVGLSILSGAHMELCSRITSLFKDNGLKTPIMLGGIIPDPDIAPLKKMGIVEVFGPGTTTIEIVDFVRGLAAKN
jgi:methylmalonyl-CoA mutase, C-terminal domain